MKTNRDYIAEIRAMQHTPGPWFFSGGAVYAELDSEGYGVPAAGIATRISGADFERIPPVERDRNMRLCAAAPRLLSAVQLLARHFGTLQETGCIGDGDVIEILAAIKQATESA